MSDPKGLAARLRRAAAVFREVAPDPSCAITVNAREDQARLLAEAADRIEFLESIAGPVSRAKSPDELLREARKL